MRLDKLRSVDLGFDGSALFRITEAYCQSYSFLGRLTTVSFLHLDMRAEFIRRYPISGRLSFRRFHDTNPCSRRIPADLKTSILRRQSWVTASKHQNLVECHCETGLPPWLQGLKKKGPRLRALGHSLTKSCAEQVAHRKWLQVMLRTTSETWAKRTGSREVSAHELRLKAGSSSGNTISLPVQQQQQQPQQPNPSLLPDPEDFVHPAVAGRLRWAGSGPTWAVRW